MNHSFASLLACLFLFSPISSFTQEAVLPPTIPWSGLSEQLIVKPTNKWVTLAEKTDFVESPRYDETVAWFRKLVAAAPTLKMVSIGKSPQGRDIWMVVASKEQAFTPSGLKASGKPLFLAQAGIHSGEIDGKDAGMMLLRDMTVARTKKHLLDRANFLFIPIFNVDGHERTSLYGRVNQRGPKEMGWRTTSRNLNLNRDFAKLDSIEMRALVKTMQTYEPDFFADIHVTDGMDYQYDITIAYNPVVNSYSPEESIWLENTMQPALFRDLAKQGHIPGLYVGDFIDDNYKKGFIQGFANPRFSSGYGDARHIPSILVETHSLKPYKQRVLGTYVLMESILKTMGETAKQLHAAIAKDRKTVTTDVVLDWDVAKGPYAKTMDFLGVESKMIRSTVTNSEYEQWLGKPTKITIPFVQATVAKTKVARAKAYVIPGTWKEIIERLAIHGVKMETLRTPQTLNVEMYRLIEPKLSDKAYEGHVPVSIVGTTTEKRQVTFPAGSVRVLSEQPLGNLVAQLLEPISRDSFFQWGFMHEILQPTEYIEDYVMQPMAEIMLKSNPTLKTEFDRKKKADKFFAKDPKAQMEWFYRQTPYADDQWLLYPIAREI